MASIPFFFLGVTYTHLFSRVTKVRPRGDRKLIHIKKRGKVATISEIHTLCNSMARKGKYHFLIQKATNFFCSDMIVERHDE